MPIRVREKTTRQEWLEWRLQNINASEVAGIMGLDKYQTPLSVHHIKSGTYTVEDTNLMRRGRWLETAIMSAVAEERPSWDVEPCTKYYDDTDLKIGATPDAFVWSPDRPGLGILQAKVVAKPTFKREWCGNTDCGEADVMIPLNYQIQTLVEAKLAGTAWGHERKHRTSLDDVWACVAALVIDAYSADLYILETEIHDGAWERIKSEVTAFWARFERGEEPPLTPERDGNLIKMLYPVDNGNAIDLSGDNELPELIERRQSISAQLTPLNKRVSDLEKAREPIDTQIKAKLGLAQSAILPDWEITWKTQHRTASTSRPIRVKRI